MKSLIEYYGPLDATQGVLLERLNPAQIAAATQLVATLEKIISPVGKKLPITMGAVSKAKAIIRDETSGDLFTRLKQSLTPDIVKPLTRLNSATGFIVALSQGLVQAAEVVTKLGDIPEDKMDTPISKVTDKAKLFQQLKAALVPDGALSFFRGMPLANEAAIAREMMGLTGNDFKAIIGAAEELTKKPEVVQAALQAAKAGAEDIKVAKETAKGAKNTKSSKAKNVESPPEEKPVPEETGSKNADRGSAPEKPAQAKPKMMPFSKKKYADALYTSIKKVSTATPEQISAFVSTVADILSKQGIPIQESTTLRGRVGGRLTESLEYTEIQKALVGAGITDEKDQAVIGYKFAKMIASDRVSDESGALSRVFPKDFKILKVPVAKANEILSAGADKANDEFWSAEGEKEKGAASRLKNPERMSIEIPVVTNPSGAKGTFIPLGVNPMTSGIIIQGRDEQENEQPKGGDEQDYEYDRPSTLWLVNVDKLKAAISAYEAKIKNQPAKKEPETPDETKTVVQQRAPAKKSAPEGA